MQDSDRAYTSLDAPLVRNESYAWWWRLIGFVSSWMILAGFLSLLPLSEDNPKLRSGTLVPIILAVAFLAAGFALTTLLYCACRSWQYRLDVIFLPALCSSSLGFLSTLYRVALSSRYEWNTAAIIGTAIGIVASVIYLCLAIIAHRRASSASTDSSLLPSHRLRNIFPSRARGQNNPRISVTGEAPVEIVTGTVSAEDELTRQQMLNLLKQREDIGRRPSAASSTYNIEMPQTTRRTGSEDRLGMPAHVHEYYSPLSVGQVHTRQGRTDSNASNAAVSGLTTLVPGGATTGDTAQSRDARRQEIELAEERQRSQSREVRRRQIETGTQ